MNSWQWYTPPIFFGQGCLFSSLVNYLASGGKRWAICCGRHFFEGVWSLWKEKASQAGLEVEAFVVSGGEPTVEVVDTLVTSLKKWQPDGLVAIGGGSVLDTTKAAAAMLVHDGSVLDYLEEVGSKQLVYSSLPWIGVPTTAGTGSEVTKNAVIIVPEKRVKRSLRHESLWARAVFLDPVLTFSTPWEVTVNTAFDAFTHLLEAAVTRKFHPWAFALADISLGEIVEGLLRLKEDGNDTTARERLLMASTAGGIVLANAGLGAVHGFAATLG
ncbi:MAG: iron-containing alcohol dehydrogenase, partial [Brevinematales bacterium]